MRNLIHRGPCQLFEVLYRLSGSILYYHFEHCQMNSGANDFDPKIEVGKFSISGWLASLLGLYLICTGVFNIAQLIRTGGNATQESSEILRQSGVDSGKAPVAIVFSYVVGAPIFFGSGLLALGSIARHVKRCRN